MEIPNIRLNVLRVDGDMLGVLLKSLGNTEATQVFITGPAAFRIVSEQFSQQTVAIQGKSWTVLPCPYGGTRADIRLLLGTFASAIDRDPSLRHICFGPSSPEVVLDYLFKPSKNGSYKAGIYALGLYDPPLSSLSQLKNAINAPGRVPGFLESIISVEDRNLLISEQQELKTLFDQHGDVSSRTYDIMAARQDQAEVAEQRLRAPLRSNKPEEKQGLFSRLFGRKSEDISSTGLIEKERRKRGLLPPPQNIGFNFKCECGNYLSVDLKNFNVFGGVEVTCAQCGAVCFIPPEILDHTKYDPSRKGATLREDYQCLLRFVRHGSK
jgi:hypothetical protein